jgi:carboxymethylenebutenolidase
MTLRLPILVACVASACTIQRWQPGQSTAVDDHMAQMSAADMMAPAVVARTGAAAQGTVGIPASAATALARLEASPRHGEWVKVPWGEGSSDSLMAWIVYPVRSDKAPVVVVVHEIFGLQTWVRGVADQLAADGYIAIAPDLISRVRGGPSSTELPADSARRLISSVSVADKNQGIDAVANYAMSLPSALHKYAVVGYCWGGSTVWQHAINTGVPGFSGAVAYYGTPYMQGSSVVQDSIAKINVPVMLLSGSGDARITAAMPAIESTMKALGKDYFGRNYEGAIHGFLRAQDDRNAQGEMTPAGAANLAAAKDAWPRTIAFLKRNLGG